MTAMTDLMNTQELAEMLKTSEKTIYRMVQSGKLPEPYRLSKRCLRFVRAEVMEWLEKIRQKS